MAGKELRLIALLNAPRHYSFVLVLSQPTPPRRENSKSPSAVAPPAAPNSSLSCRFASSVSDGKRRGGKRLSNPFFLAPSCVGVMALPTASSYHNPPAPHPPHPPLSLSRLDQRYWQKRRASGEGASERGSAPLLGARKWMQGDKIKVSSASRLG